MSFNISPLLAMPILCFFLGVAFRILSPKAHWPSSLIKRILTFYLLVAIGWKGGAELAQVSLLSSLFPIAGAFGLSLIIPIVSYIALCRLGGVDRLDAAAIAAHYGSVSVATFITAAAFLKDLHLVAEPYPLIMLVIMEYPGVLAGIILADRVRSQRLKGKTFFSLRGLFSSLKDALTHKSMFPLIGAMIGGYAFSYTSLKVPMFFLHEVFSGVLYFFLFSIGREAARHIDRFSQIGRFLVIFGVLMPLFGGIVGALVGAKMLGFSVAGTTLVATLSASASYIVAPAIIHQAIPEANPGLYLSLPLAVTFPFNVVIGIPLYYFFALRMIG